MITAGRREIILVVDKNHNDAGILVRELQVLDPTLLVIGLTGSANEAVSWLISNPCPDLILMELTLDESQSIDSFANYPAACPIIYTTFYQKKLIHMLEDNDIDYLLKPVTQDSLRNIIEKIRAQKRAAMARKATVTDAKTENAYLSRIIVKKGSEYIVIQTCDILYFNSENGVVFIVTNGNKKFIVTNNLVEFESKLDPKIFFRASRQFILNGNYISGFSSLGKSKLKVHLNLPVKDDILISQYNSGAFKTWLENCQYP